MRARVPRVRRASRSLSRGMARATAALLGVWLAALGVLATAAPAAAQMQFTKPATWTSGLVTWDNQAIKDADFATWIKGAQTALAPGAGFKLIASFTQCYGGGFVTELRNKAVAKYGANSASAYFETVSYAKTNSYYDFAWKTLADVPAPFPTDQAITTSAWNAIANIAPVAGIPTNDDAQFERAQYLTDAAGGGAPPAALNSATNLYAILWVGQPNTKGNQDAQDLDDLYNVLTRRYGYPAANIYILFGSGANPAVPAGHLWAPNAAATSAKLQAAINTWLVPKVQAKKNMDNLLFFWAGDHGNADYPITIEVDDGSQGVPRSAVAALAPLNQVGMTIYEAGAGTNVELLQEATGTQLKALSFGDDFFNPQALFQTSNASPPATIYFSVDNQSSGLPGTDVNQEIVNGRFPGADVYAADRNGGNLRMFDGMVSLGLLKAAPNFDELNDFVLRDLQSILTPQGWPTRPIFFANDQTSQIWVYDPMLNQTYLYYDFTWNLPVAPVLVDALAMVANLQRRDNNNHLFFDPAKDYMLFSVGRQENMAPWNLVAPCDILQLANNVLRVWQTCAQLGLDPSTDNVDGLDIGAGQYSQPISWDEEYPWPSYPYPNSPDGWGGGPRMPPSPMPHSTLPVEIEVPD